MHWGWGVMALLTACNARAEPDEGPASGAAKDSSSEAPVPRIVFVGTSLTAGYGLSPDQAWTADIQSRIDAAGWQMRVVNAGVSGETSAGALRRMEWVLGQGNPALVMIETGANDGLRGLPIESLTANLDSILTLAGQVRPRPAIVVTGMEALPNMGRAYVNRFRQVFPRAAQRHHAAYLPFLLDGVAGVARLNQADGIHPNPEGSDRVADNVWAVLEPILDSIVVAEGPPSR